MKALMQKQIIADYHEVFSSEAGRRVLGGIFYWAGLNAVSGWSGAEAAAYAAGKRDLGLAIANTLRKADALGVGSCELAYAKFVKIYGKDDGNGNNGEYEDDAGGTD